MVLDYPILDDLRERQLHNDILCAGLPTPPPLPFETDLQMLKFAPIDSDNYLQNSVAVITKYFHLIEPIIPHQFRRIVQTRIDLRWRFWGSAFSFDKTSYAQGPSATISDVAHCASSIETPVPAMKSKPFEQDMPIPPPIKSIEDALAYLNFAELHSNRLAKMLDKVSSIGMLTEQVDRWRQLKKNLVEFSKIINKILQSYKYQMHHLPDVGELKKVKNKITKLISKTDKEEVSRILGKRLDFSPAELVTAALGMDESVALALDYIRKSLCTHQTDQYHIKDFVLKAVEENYDADVSAVLAAAGFSLAKASLLAEQLESSDLFVHQPLTYWVEWFIDYMFQYDIFLNLQCPRFPHNEDTLDSWIPIPTTRTIYDESTEEETELVFEVPVYNTVQGIKSVTRDGVCYPPSAIEDGVWYHATDHASAESIRANGIILTTGNKRQDFSHGDGFYLTPYLHFAEKWAEKKGGPSKSAIVVFKHSINAAKYKGMDLCLESDETWSQVVKYYRSGKQRKCPKKLEKRLSDTDYIEGPMSGDNTRCMHPNWQPSKKRGDSNQLCIKSEELADEFSNNIDGIIFMSSENNHLVQ